MVIQAKRVFRSHKKGKLLSQVWWEKQGRLKNKKGNDAINITPPGKGEKNEKIISL